MPWNPDHKTANQRFPLSLEDCLPDNNHDSYFSFFSNCAVDIGWNIDFPSSYGLLLLLLLARMLWKVCEENVISWGFWVSHHLPFPVTINNYFSLRAKLWLRGGVGGQFPRNLNWPRKCTVGEGEGGGWEREEENVFAQTLSEQVPIKNFPQLPLPVTASNTKIQSFLTPPPAGGREGGVKRFNLAAEFRV